MSDPLLRITGLAKHFGGEQALDDVDLDLGRGEIHALLGENGAGKSTLVKILAGVVIRDAGEVSIDGENLSVHPSPTEIRKAGLAFVHQDLGLADHLSVAENIALATGYRRRGRLIRFRATARDVQSRLDALGIEVRAQRLVGNLAQDEKVMVAVARAFSLDAKAIVLDEVSSSLPAPEAARLGEALKETRRRGMSYLYITHRLDEVFELADRITVLRDGRRVATAVAGEVTRDDVVESIVGSREIVESFRAPERRPAPTGPVRLEVLGLDGPGLTKPLSFQVREGEKLALCGLVGCGAREVAGMIGGAVKPLAGEATLDGQRLPLGSPRRLREAGCSYVPGDRQREGALLSMSIRENFFLSRAGDGASTPLRVPARERAQALALAERFAVTPRRRVDKPLSSLSGGNQQKVICGRALRVGPKLLVLDDPTAGVDVGSRAQLHSIVTATAETGTPVVFASTDYEEVVSEADRALVLWNGAVYAELSGSELTQERLAQACYGTGGERGMKESA